MAVFEIETYSVAIDKMLSHLFALQQNIFGQHVIYIIDTLYVKYILSAFDLSDLHLKTRKEIKIVGSIYQSSSEDDKFITPNKKCRKRRELVNIPIIIIN